MLTVVYSRVDSIIGRDLSDHDERVLRGIVEHLLYRHGIYDVTSDCPRRDATPTQGSSLQENYDRLDLIVQSMIGTVGYRVMCKCRVTVHSLSNGRCIFLELR